MKLKNIFKKNTISLEQSNFKAIEKTHLQKIAGGDGGTATGVDNLAGKNKPGRTSYGAIS
jgi:hypothetical protein